MTLAHGSGIDDILMFVIPVALAVVALRVAEKRARARIESEQADAEGAEPAQS